MQLNINSPAYYSNQYGVDDEIYLMCREISRFMNDKNYSEKIDTVGIVPIIAPKELIQKGLWQQEIKYDMKIKLAYVSKWIDFDEYRSSDIEGRRILILKNILDSMKSISRKANLDYDSFKKDLLNFLGINLN